jgi:hypothetical protein
MAKLRPVEPCLRWGRIPDPIEALLLSALLAAVTKYLGYMLPIPVVLFESLDFFLSLLSITVLFAMIFKLLPKTKIAWSDVCIGGTHLFVIYCWEVCHWALHREECSGFRLRGRRLFGGGHRMDLLLRVDPVFWRGIHASLRAHAGFATQRRGPNQSCWTFV